MTDAFGIVALIAMAPLITIQVLGLISNLHRRRMLKHAHNEFGRVSDDIVYFD